MYLCPQVQHGTILPALRDRTTAIAFTSLRIVGKKYDFFFLVICTIKVSSVIPLELCGTFLLQNFVTDLSASKVRLDEIDRKVGEFVENKHSQLDAIRTRSRQIHGR